MPFHRALPEVRSDETFQGGHLIAHMVFVRKEDRTPICRSAFIATSSEVVEVDKVAGADCSVDFDLKKEVKAAAREAVGRASAVLRYPDTLAEVEDFLDAHHP